MQWFYNLRTSAKLAASFGTVLLMMLVVAYAGVTAAQAMKANQEATYTTDLRTLELADKSLVTRLKMARRTRDAIISPEPGEVAAAIRDLRSMDETFHRDLDALDGVITDEAGRADLADIRRVYPLWWPLVLESIELSPTGESKGDVPKMLATLRQASDMGRGMDARVESIVARAKATARARAEASDAQGQRSRNITLSLTAVVFLIGIGCTLLITRAIATPLKACVDVLERVSEGDLTARLAHDSKDEIGQVASALNASLESIGETLLAVQGTSVELSAASSQLSASAQQLSSGAQEQAASLEETAASLEEISSTVKQNTDNAMHASQLAEGARDAASLGGSVVESAVSAMNEITASSRRIAEIITTIDEIAFQTNLLALNAAVEAARAGEQGRGFGVVAAEVRTLAQRTGAAAKDIRGLIADSTAKVEVGTFKVNESGQTLVEIVKSVKRVTDTVAEIAAASREQSTGVEQVNTAVTQVDQVTQLNAAQTEELSATASSLAEKATELQARVARFQLGAPPSGGASSREARPAPKPVARLATKTMRAATNSPAPQMRKAAGGYEEF